jgi:hypothetical protein
MTALSLDRLLSQAERPVHRGACETNATVEDVPVEATKSLQNLRAPSGAFESIELAKSFADAPVPIATSRATHPVYKRHNTPPSYVAPEI